MSDLPRHAEAKVALHFLDRRGDPSSKEGIQPWRRYAADLGSCALGRMALIGGLSLVPISIAASEFFLSIAVVVQAVRLVRKHTRMHLPRCFWFWLLWTGLEFVVWAQSPQPALGWSEIRHIFLIGGVFVALPALDRKADCQTVWKGIFITSSLSSAF